MAQFTISFLDASYWEGPNYEAPRRSLECWLTCCWSQPSPKRSPYLPHRFQFRHFRSVSRGLRDTLFFQSARLILIGCCLFLSNSPFRNKIWIWVFFFYVLWQEKGIKTFQRSLPNGKVRQIFFFDPDGKLSFTKSI